MNSSKHNNKASKQISSDSASRNAQDELSKELRDEELLLRIGEHQDREALALLYDRYRHSLGGFLRRKLRESRLIDEVYNDVMFTVWNKADTFRGDSKVSTWIFGIAYRTCLSHARKESRHSDQIDEFEIDQIAENSQDYSDQNDDITDSLNSAISELSEDHRTVIELAYFIGNSIVEIAEIMACPVNTVKTRLYHARLHLKTNLQDQLS